MIAGEPLALLRDWLPPNAQQERPQIQVATVDADGRPDIRTVLLSEWDEHGFVFHTDSASRKVAQLQANPSVAIDVLWPGFSRQLVVRGYAEPQDAAGLERAYAARSPYLRQLAWQNTDEVAQLDPAGRSSAWTRFSSEHDLAALSPSPTWTGFVVRPDRLTFWYPDPLGPSHRVEFSEIDGAWFERQLPG